MNIEILKAEKDQPMVLLYLLMLIHSKQYSTALKMVKISIKKHFGFTPETTLMKAVLEWLMSQPEGGEDADGSQLDAPGFTI